MLQQKENIVEIVGTLSEIDMREGKTSTGQDYLGGTIKIRCNFNYHNQPIEAEIPVSVYANKFKNDGGKNPSYESLERVKNDMVSIAACGNAEDASYVRIYANTDGLSENSFYSRTTGQLVNAVRVRTGFVNQVPRSRYEDGDIASFDTVIFVLAIDDEVDKDGMPTGNLKIKGGTADYRGKLNVIDYKVTNKDAIEHIRNYWTKGDTVKVHGYFNYISTVDTIEEEVGFGDTIKRHITRSKKELIITSGSPGGFDADNSFDSTEMAKAIKERKADLEAKKNPPAPAAAPTRKAPQDDWGF